MKFITQLFGIVLFFAVITVSCKKDKHHQPITKTIDVTLGMNETYSFTFPTNKNNLIIERQASHALNSDLTADNTTGLFLYNYTPATDFVGTDEISITTLKEDNGHGNHAQGILPGGCYGGSGVHHDDDNTVTYVFKINVLGVSKPG